MDLSVIIPLYNEEDSVELMHQRIREATDPLGKQVEILFVDDGSADRTFEKCKVLAASDPLLRIIKFRKNYGQTPAMVAGIDNARGEILVTMDGDLQNDPGDIPLFLQEMQKGFDIVVGWRFNRQDKLVTRKIPSKIANWLIGKVTGVPIKDNGCSLKAYRASIVKKIPLYSEMHRFIPAMMSMAGVRISEIKVRHHARQFGQSKYGLSRIYKVLLDLLTIKTLISFVARPLVWFGSMAIISALISLGILISLLFASDISLVAVGISLLLACLTLFLLFAGVLSELVYRTGDLKQESFSGLTATFLETRETA